MLSPRCTISSLGNNYLSGQINDLYYINSDKWKKQKRYHEALENPLILEKIMDYVERDDRPGCFFFARALVYLGYEVELDKSYIAHTVRRLVRKNKRNVKNGDYQRFRNILYGRTVGYYCTRCFDKIKCGNPLDCISYRPLCDDCFSKVYKDKLSENEARTLLLMLGFSKESVEIACLGLEFTKSKSDGRIKLMSLSKRREMKEGIMKGMYFLPFRRMGKSATSTFLRRHIVQLDGMFVGRRQPPRFTNIYTFLSDATDKMLLNTDLMCPFEANMCHNIIENNEWFLKSIRRRYGVDKIVWDKAISKIRAALQERVQDFSDARKASLAQEVIMMDVSDRLAEAFCKICDGSCLRPIIKQLNDGAFSNQFFELDMCFGCELSEAEAYNNVYGWESNLGITSFTMKLKKDYRTKYLAN